MAAGLIRRQDARRLAGWLTRIAIIAVVAPPEDDLEAALDTVLLPLLDP